MREHSGIRGHRAASLLGWSDSKISRLERGRCIIKESQLEALLDLYGPSAERRHDLLSYFLEMANRRTPTAVIDHASMLREWAPMVIPEILQTPAYMRAVLAELQLVQLTPPSEIENAIAANSPRQSRLSTGLPPLSLEVVIGEAALGNGFGDRTTMRNQLEQLIVMASLPAVGMRIMRAGIRAGGPRSLCAFGCLSFPALQASTLPDVVNIPAMVPIQLQNEPETWPHMVAFRRLWDMADPEPIPVLKAHHARWSKSPD